MFSFIYIPNITPHYSFIFVAALILVLLFGFLRQTKAKTSPKKQIKESFIKLQKNLKENKK